MKTCPVCSRETDRDFNAYAAGLIDGEGSITISKRSEKDGYSGYGVTVAIEMAIKAAEVLNRMHWNFAGAIGINRQKGGKTAGTIRWTTSGRATACVLRRLLPFLVLKQRQAEIVIDLYSRPWLTAPNGDTHWTPERLAAFQCAREEVMALNAKGVQLFDPTEVALLVGNRWVKRNASLFGEQWETFSGPWPRSGSMRRGHVYEQAPSAPLTSATACSSWPTISVGDSESGQTKPSINAKHAGGDSRLRVAVATWPTPKVSPSTYEVDPRGNTYPSLPLAARLWATPTARDHKDGACEAADVPTNALLGRQAVRWPTPTAAEGPKGTCASESREGTESLSVIAAAFRPAPPTPTDGVASSPPTPTSRPRLNPDFVDWMMGWEPGWTCACARGLTACAPLETESSTSRQRSRSGCSPNDSGSDEDAA